MSSTGVPAPQKEKGDKEYDATMAKIASSFSSLYKSHYGGAPTGGIREDQRQEPARDHPPTQRPATRPHTDTHNKSVNSDTAPNVDTQQAQQQHRFTDKVGSKQSRKQAPPLPLNGDWESPSAQAASQGRQQDSGHTEYFQQQELQHRREKPSIYDNSSNGLVAGRRFGSVAGNHEPVRQSTTTGPQNLAQRAKDRQKLQSRETETVDKKRTESHSSFRSRKEQLVGSSRSGGLEKYSSYLPEGAGEASSQQPSKHRPNEIDKPSSRVEAMVSSAESVVATARGLATSSGPSEERRSIGNENGARSSSTTGTPLAPVLRTASVNRGKEDDHRVKSALQQWSLLRSHSSRELPRPHRSRREQQETHLHSPVRSSPSSSLTQNTKLEIPPSRQSTSDASRSSDTRSRLRVLVPVKDARSWRESVNNFFGSRSQASFAILLTSKLLANAVEQATSSLRDSVEEDYGPRFADRVAAMKGYQFRTAVKEVLMSVSLAFGVFDTPLIKHLIDTCARFLPKQETTVATTLNFDRSTSSTVNSFSSPASSASESVVGDVVIESYDEIGFERTAIVTPQHAYLPQPLVEIISEEGLELVRIDELEPATVSWFGPEDIYDDVTTNPVPTFYLNCLPEAIASRLASKLSLEDFVETIAEASDQLASSVDPAGVFDPEFRYKRGHQGYLESSLTLNDELKLWMPTTAEANAIKAGSSLQVSSEVTDKYILSVNSFLNQHRPFNLPSCPPTWKLLMSEYCSRMETKHIGDKRKCWDLLNLFVSVSRQFTFCKNKLKSFRLRASGRIVFEGWQKLLTAKRHYRQRTTKKFLPLWKDATEKAKREYELYVLAVEHANEALLRNTFREWCILVAEEKHEARARRTADVFYENRILKRYFHHWSGALARTRNLHALNEKAQQRISRKAIRHWQEVITHQQRTRLATVAAHDWYYLRLAIRSFNRIQTYCRDQRNMRKAEALQRFHLQRRGIDHWRFSIQWKRRTRETCYRLVEIRKSSELRIAYRTWVDVTCKQRRLQYALYRREAVLKYQVFQSLWEYMRKRKQRAQDKKRADSYCRSLLERKAFSWWQDMYRDLQTLLAVQEYYRIRLQRKCWSTWRTVVEETLRMRRLKIEAEQKRREFLLKRYFHIWNGTVRETHVEAALDAAARAHFSLSLSRRVWRHWRNVVDASRERQTKADMMKCNYDLQLIRKHFMQLKSETFRMMEEADSYRGSLQAHNALKRWMKFTHNRLVRDEATRLAQLQYRSVLLRKIFDAWDEGVALSKAERQMQNEVVQWYQRKLTKHVLYRWKRGVADGLLQTEDDSDQREEGTHGFHSGQRLSTPSTPSSSPSSLQGPVVVNERGQYVDSEATRPVAIALGRSGQTVSAAFSSKTTLNYSNEASRSKDNKRKDAVDDTGIYPANASPSADRYKDDISNDEHRRARIVEARQRYAKRGRKLARKYAIYKSNGQFRQSASRASERSLSRKAQPLPSLEHIVGHSASKRQEALQD
eukprot:gb/GECG01015902.1/.p1 GENE.gb/GECG01015902.1/~~gb/GECG01015902.1/.p1  ORF type:complete len:1494 (+),score=210.54 gb/GECG01015902.1/:1-4482(+)